MYSNQILGLTTIEEGELKDGEIILNLKYKKTLPRTGYFLPKKVKKFIV